MNKVEIYYFSGSGNSLHVTKELQKRIPEAKVIPIVSLLHKAVIATNAETIGFVFPVHGMTVPIPVKDFIKKADLKSAKYIFAAAARCGTKCFAFEKINEILKEKGKALDSQFILNMANNDPKFEVYEIPTKEKIEEIESEIQNQLDSIQKIVINKEKSLGEDTAFIYPSGFLLEKLVLFGMRYAEYDGCKDYYYADSKCAGCGVCEKVCLSRKIKMIDKKPVWRDDVKCYLCYACINYCPMQAAQIKSKWYMKSYTDKNGRYPHPYAGVEDIAEQKGIEYEKV